MESEHDDERWNQTRSGIALIDWSRLARFDKTQLTFEASGENEFEHSPEGHREIHPEFGRLICWISFSVGAEYLSKGVYLLNGDNPTIRKPTKVLLAPKWDDNLEKWCRLVNSRNPSVKDNDESLGTLGELGNKIGGITALESENKGLVSAAIKYLASTIRNRDAHRYAPDERAAHFRAVPRIFVPAFNFLLACVDKDELRSRLRDIELRAQT